jgi:hypothetical protein
MTASVTSNADGSETIANTAANPGGMESFPVAAKNCQRRR